MARKPRIVIALGGNALGKTLPEQMIAAKTTSKAIADLVEEGYQVVISHGNGLSHLFSFFVGYIFTIENCYV